MLTVVDDLLENFELPEPGNGEVLDNLSNDDKAPLAKKQIPEDPSRLYRRAGWLADRLQERNWSKHDVSRHNGPDHKTVQKILDGDPVRADVLGRLAHALSTKRRKSILWKFLATKPDHPSGFPIFSRFLPLKIQYVPTVAVET